ncbi:MAG: T9SS type A sorting domain-containing protein [Bacteroidales bacterium]|nr:T9SS type A sorting domain-containing protein [Bacteroidales bacterium]
MKKLYPAFITVAVLLLQTLTLDAQSKSPASACNLLVNMTDDYGDGWTGAAINFIQNGEVVASVTLEDGYSGSEYVLLEEGTTEFEWVPGEYPFECGFAIYDMQETLIYQTQGAQTIGVFFTYEHVCFEVNTWTLSGYVTSSATGNALAAATVFLDCLQSVTGQTDENGYYSVDVVENIEYDIHVSAEGYNEFVELGFVQPANDLTMDFELDNPEMDVNVNDIYTVTEYMTDAVETIEITNTGNGVLSWKNRVHYNGKNPETIAYMFNALDEEPTPYLVPLNDPESAAMIQGAGNPPFDMISGGDYFNHKWYVIDPNMAYLISIDPQTGNANFDLMFDRIDVYGLCYNVSDGQVYIKTPKEFYTLDTITGLTQYQFSMTTATLNFAITNDGRFITVDNENDVILEVDPATGTETILMAVGFNANYCQGLAIDRETNTLYWAGFNFDTFRTFLYIVNLDFNVLEYVGELPGNMVGFAIPTEAGWLQMSPQQGIVEPGETQTVQLTMDGSWAEEGTFLATLNLVTEDPNIGETPIDITFVIGEDNAIYELSENNHDVVCFPNPVSEMLYLRFETVSTVNEVSIYDTKGHRVYKHGAIAADVMQIPTSSLSPGIYFARIVCADTTKTVKFIKL